MRLAILAVKAVLLSGVVLTIAAVGWAGDIKGKVSVQGLKSSGNIAVYVDAIPGKKFDAPTEHVVVDQKKMEFIPQVVVFLQGRPGAFKKTDWGGHNVFWASISGNKKLTHNLGTWPKGDKKSFQFNDLGVAPLLCNVHPEMSGYVVVVAAPYFAVTDKDGNYEIKNVPAGKYNLKTWSEDGKPTTQAVEVTAGGATADLIVKK